MRFRLLTLPLMVAAACGGPEDQSPTSETSDAIAAFSISLWPNGQVPYKFDDGTLGTSIGSADRTRVRDRMEDWEDAMTTAHASNNTYINFYECTTACPASGHLRIRYNTSGESGMACSIGRNEDGDGTMRMGLNTSDDSTLRHELGHCIGIGHEHARGDRDRWLLEGSYVYEDGTASASGIPLLGNYDYDSIMHYASYKESSGTSGELRWRDRESNAFSRWESAAISPHDASRALQYYAREYMDDWGFFESLNSVPASADSLPNPRLATNVEAVGTPAISYQPNGDFDVFVRGSDQNMYWKSFRGSTVSSWSSLGCCFGSDPSAVSFENGRIDVAAVGASSGKMMISTWDNNSWGPWYYIEGGYPTGGIKTASGGGYIGPALVSRASNRLDAFVVRTDGRMSVVSYDGGGWSSWQTLGSSYVVTARPGAAEQSSTQVQLAISRSGTLYEPRVTFSGTTVTGFTMGSAGISIANVAPAVAARNDSTHPYRVLVVNSSGRISHRFSASSSWRDIGGIPKSGTGVAAVQTGSFRVNIVMNGTDAIACEANCIPGDSPNAGDEVQPGGLWLRKFE